MTPEVVERKVALVGSENVWRHVQCAYCGSTMVFFSRAGNCYGVSCCSLFPCGILLMRMYIDRELGTKRERERERWASWPSDGPYYSGILGQGPTRAILAARNFLTSCLGVTNRVRV